MNIERCVCICSVEYERTLWTWKLC